VHGTGPGSQNKGNLHGVAFYCKPTVVSRIRKVNANIRFEADAKIKKKIAHRRDYM